MIATSSTIEGSKTAIASSKCIIPSTVQLYSHTQEKKAAQRSISIIEEHSHKTLTSNR